MKILIDKRHILMMMLQLGVALMYTYGTVHNLTRPYIYQIIVPNNTMNDTKSTVARVCPSSTATIKRKRLTAIIRSREDQHRLKFTFAASKVLAHFVSGNMCDISGSRYILLFSVFTSALLIAFYPTMILYLPPWVELIYNMFLGFQTGLVMPLFMNLIANWSPLNRRTMYVGMVYSGAPISIMMEYGLIEYFILVAEFWQGIYYLLALVGIGYCLVGLFTIFSKPYSHPFISDRERLLLENENGRNNPKRIPWKQILTDSRIYAILAGKLGHLWIQYLKSNFLPSYYRKVMKFDLAAYGSLALATPSIIHYLGSVIWAILAQVSINKNTASLVHMRIFFTMFGALIPSIFLVAMSYGECNIILGQLTSVILHVGMAPMNLGVKSNILDLTRNFAGFCEGFINGLASACGMFMQPLVSVLIKQDGILEWRSFFWITLAYEMYLVTLHYVFVGVNRAHWDALASDSTDYNDDQDI